MTPDKVSSADEKRRKAIADWWEQQSIRELIRLRSSAPRTAQD